MSSSNPPGTNPSWQQQTLIQAARQQAEIAWDGARRRAASDAALPLPPDRPIPGYVLVREVHRGSQGVVYEALHETTRRRVAIKVLREGPFAGTHDRMRFEREVHILGQLDHPGIVSVHASGQAGGCEYFVMDYVAGEPLDVCARRLRAQPGRAGWRQLLELFADICEAVHAAHVRGVIHRDLKPGNIRVDARGRPRVLDFGLAKVADLAGVSAGVVTTHHSPLTTHPLHTDTGHFVGSLPWASPEQLEGQPAAIDIRTDVYALGVVLYHALTGEFPYPVGGRLSEVVQGIATAEPIRPSRRESRVDDELDTIVLKCLAKERDRRYQTAGELARDIRHYLAGEPIEAKRDSPTYLLRKQLRRHRSAVLVSAGMVLLLVIGFVVSLTFWQRAEQQREVAEQRRVHAEAVMGLVEQMLAPADPHKVRDGRLTARQLVDEFAAGLPPAPDVPPEVEASVRTIIGTAYRGLGQYDRAAEHLDAALRLRGIPTRRATDHPEDYVYTLIACAWLRHDRGDYNSAAEVFEQALAALPADPHALAPYRAEVLAGLADLHRHRGAFDEAESLARQALELVRAHFGPQDWRAALGLQTLAGMLRARGRLAEAEPLLREALAGLQRARGDDHPLVAIALGELAALREEQGALVEAEGHYRQALTIRRRTLAGDHPMVAAVLNSLGALQWRQGRYAEADQTLREALELKRRILGDDDPDVAVTLATLLLIAKERGDLAEAEALGREAVAILRRHGQERPNLAATLSNLAWVLHARGDLDGAEPLFREGLAVAREVYGETHPVVAAAANNLGTLLLTRGQHAAAEPLFAAALRTWEGAYGRKHPHVAACLANLAKVHQALGEAQQAESLLREALEINREVLGRGHPTVATHLAHLADLLQRRGEPSAAEPLLRECLEIRRAALSQDHWIIGLTECLLGACLVAQGRLDDAEELLTGGYQGLTASGQAPDSAVREALEHLVRFYDLTNRSDRAAEYRTKLAQLHPQ